MGLAENNTYFTTDISYLWNHLPFSKMTFGIDPDLPIYNRSMLGTWEMVFLSQHGKFINRAGDTLSTALTLTVIVPDSDHPAHCAGAYFPATLLGFFIQRVAFTTGRPK